MSMSDTDSKYSICTQENQYEEKQHKGALRKVLKELFDLENAPAIKAERDLHVEERVVDKAEEDSSVAMSVLVQEEDFLAKNALRVEELVADEAEEDISVAMSVLTQEEDFLLRALFVLKHL